MSLKMKAKSGGGSFEQPEPGNQAAVLVAIVDLGTIEKTFKDNVYDAEEIYLCWELVNQKMTGSEFNHVIGRSYTKSLNSEKSNLRNMISKWRGKQMDDGEEFDLAVLLGKKCLLDVQLTKDGKYCRLEPTCAALLPKGMDCPPAKRKLTTWEIDGNDRLPEHLDWLPFLFGESIQDRIGRSHEWKSKKGIAGGKERVGSNGKQADEAPVDEETEDGSDNPF